MLRAAPTKAAGRGWRIQLQRRGGDAKGAGYVHYDRETGNVNSGGVAKIGDEVYAGRDGNVYHYETATGSPC